MPSDPLPRVLARGCGRRIAPFLSRYGLLIGFLVLWQVSPALGWVNPAVFPPLDADRRGALEGDLRRARCSTTSRSACSAPASLSSRRWRSAFRSACSWARSRRSSAALDPILQLFRQTSALALYPVFILLLGLGEDLEGLRDLLGDAVPDPAGDDRRREGGRSAS